MNLKYQFESFTQQIWQNNLLMAKKVNNFQKD